MALSYRGLSILETWWRVLISLANRILIFLSYSFSFFLLAAPGPRDRLLGDTNHPGVCTSGGTGGELQ